MALRTLVRIALLALALPVCAAPARAVDRPFISDTFFYWYTWDYDQERGNWIGGIYNTPLEGYYDSRTYRDNYRSLRTASEWGITHHFMDYWAPTWKADTGEMREAVVMRAAEKLREEGYNIWMSYYQDGENFAMRDFARNVTEKRDVHQWLRDFSRSPVWPRVKGLPIQLVYGRNGAPEPTAEDAGFRDFLRHHYGDIARLNAEWGSRYRGFDDITYDLATVGWPRALAVRYQYELWEKDWGTLQEAVHKEFGHPGIFASQDVGYKPYRGLSFARFTRLFGGPHSYGGIFSVPHDQDAERFVQSILAKKYDTLFFDHFKNFYHDWEIRIPGTGYLPDPYHFDRFWVGDLMRANEGIVHLSWNEWWEGSNLEPCLEYGKTYCEKNLFYSTIMQECFPAIQAFGRDAKVGVLLNDWLVEAGCENADEALAAIQALRRSMIPFDLIADEFATAKELSRFSLIIAPSGALGFGRNGAEEPIADLLLEWVRGAPGRRLVLSGTPALREALGVRTGTDQPAQAAKPGPDMNVFVDVGTEGDDRFLRGGSGREDWGKLAADQFGAASQPLTVRWTPGIGKRISFTLPASPGRDHLLRVHGRAFKANRVQVLVEEQPAGEVAVGEAFGTYEVAVPASLIRSRRLVRVAFVYPDPVIPTKIDPAGYPNENRACNLALDWVQWSTANIGPSREQRYTMPEERMEWASPRLTLPVAHSEFEPLALPRPARALSRYVPAGTPRDIALAAGKGQVLLVNGLLSDTSSPAYWEQLLTGWAGRRAPVAVSGKEIMGARLSAGDTDLLFAYNEDGAQPTDVSVTTTSRPTRTSPPHHLTTPVASVRVLARDGAQWQSLPFKVEGGKLSFRDKVRYYAVYEVARSAVRVTWPNPVLHPGEGQSVPVHLENLTDRPVKGMLELQSYVPTVNGKDTEFTLPARGRATVPFRVGVLPGAEWGRRTVVLRVHVDGRVCSLWQPLVVERNPELRLDARYPAPGEAVVTVRNLPSRYIGTGAASELRLTTAGKTFQLGTLKAGESRTVKVTLPPPAPGEAFIEVPAELQYASGFVTHRDKQTLRAPCIPASLPRVAGAEAAYQVCNPAGRPVDGQLVPLGPAPSEPAHVREPGGHVVPSQVSGGKLYALASLRAGEATTLYRCPGEAPASLSDLRLEAQGLGTGKGRVTLRNSRLSLTVDEASGGLVTSLVSAATGYDYGARSFGATEGVFGKPDPKRPALPSTDYIVDKRKGIETPARITVDADGPLFAAVRVTATLGARKVTTRFRMSAHSSEIQVERTVEAAAALAGSEVVVLDVPLRRNAITKIFPNFTGVVEEKPQPHFGWREGPHVPPYASLMTPDAYRESLSFLVKSQQGLARFRQGIWPASRTKPGPAEFARIEYIAAPGAKQASVVLTLLVHEGHQRVARRRLEEPAPYAVPLPSPQWQGEAATAPPPAGWHLPYHHGRAPLTVAGTLKPGEWIGLALPEGMPAGADYRLVAIEGDRHTVQPLRPDAGLKTIGWTATGEEAGRRYLLYFDERAGGADPPLPTPRMVPGDKLLDPSFEEESPAWQLGNAHRVEAEGAGGRFAVRLECREKGAMALVSNGTLALRPNSRYRLTFRAKAEGGHAVIRTNLYAGGAYDYPQHAIGVDPGEWRRWTAELTTGPFPLGIQPALRLWVLDPGHAALVDDVALEWLDDLEGKAPASRVEIGPVEQSRSM